MQVLEQLNVTMKNKKENAVGTSSAKPQEKGDFSFVFGKLNYILLIAGVVLLALGYIMLCGGGSEDPNVFNDAMFDTRRLVVAPVCILAGFVVEIFAIMVKPKEK